MSGSPVVEAMSSTSVRSCKLGSQSQPQDSADVSQCHVHSLSSLNGTILQLAIEETLDCVTLARSSRLQRRGSM